jgi:hypothetical protein
LAQLLKTGSKIPLQQTVKKGLCHAAHAGSDDPGAFFTLLACCIPGLFIMIARGFVDNGIFCGAGGAGEPDNIPASGSGNLGFYGCVYHCFMDDLNGFFSG